MQTAIDILQISSIAILISFTGTMIYLAARNNGALIYYYEPNKKIMLAEIILGGFAILMAFYTMYEIAKPT